MNSVKLIQARNSAAFSIAVTSLHLAYDATSEATYNRAVASTFLSGQDRKWVWLWVCSGNRKNVRSDALNLIWCKCYYEHQVVQSNVDLRFYIHIPTIIVKKLPLLGSSWFESLKVY